MMFRFGSTLSSEMLFVAFKNITFATEYARIHFNGEEFWNKFAETPISA